MISINLPLFLLLVGGAFVLLALFAPRAFMAPYTFIRRVALGVAAIIGPVVFTVLFFVMVVPIGVLRRIFARDSLMRAFSSSDSYFIKHEPRAPEHVRHPF